MTEPVVSSSAGRYLEAAYYIRNEGEVVRPGRLADWLGVAPPTVTQALARLVRVGLLASGPDRTVEFTPAGLRAAEEIVRRHRVVEVWLNRVLEFDWVSADLEAQSLAHALSDQVLDRLHEVLGRPATCPHGNPIPGVPQPAATRQSLATLPAGRSARVGRISEVAEHEAPQLLTLLYDAGLVPGTELVVEATTEAEVVVRTATARHSLPGWAAAAVWVEAGAADAPARRA